MEFWTRLIRRQVRAARDAGFDLICTGQHYLAAPYQMSTSFPLLARLAAEAGDMEVAATVCRFGTRATAASISTTGTTPPRRCVRSAARAGFGGRRR